MSEVPVSTDVTVPGGAGSEAAPSDPWNEFLTDDASEDFNPEPPVADSDEGFGEDSPPAPSQPSAPSEAVAVPPTPAEKPTEPVVTEAQTSPAPVSGEPAPASEVVTPSTPPAPAAPAQDLSVLRSNWETELARQYAMSDEDATKIITDTGTAIPALAAKLHVAIFDQVIQTVVGMMHQQLPQLVDQVQVGRKVATDAEEAFFSEWAELRPHREKVMEIATAYRQLNPQAKPEEFRKAVGMQAWMMLGRSPAELVVKLNGGQVPPVSAAPTQAPGRVIPLPPVQPANSGSVGVGQPQGPVNPYVEMANSWLEEID